MSIERVKTYFQKYGIQEKIQEFDVSSATVELAAAALGCEPQRIAKSLSFMANGHALLVVAAGDARIDNRKYKEQFHTKAKMLSAEEVENLVGHAVGGVCPFAVKDGVDIYLDVSLNFPPAAVPTARSDSRSRNWRNIPDMWDGWMSVKDIKA